ncbi:GIY-YIG nuclease family protein [Ligilactobacillus hayakitensis]|uniref:GIY-YIG nuclease family protein n=1 Tax=Ligilactobacillus hayakitensis TaxID=396716 RepID=UPI00046A0F43|nr:GIY-YIG nuclease family protein [Ligilactobacillus hayakitensis]
MGSKQIYYFYVLLCADNTLYGGFTTDLQRRFKQHSNGTGAKYTRVKSRHPLKMIYHEEFETKNEALKKEYEFKHQSRDKKLEYLRKNGVNLKN